MDLELFPRDPIIMEALLLMSGRTTHKWRSYQSETIARFHEECALIRSSKNDPEDRHREYNRAGARLDQRLFQGLWREFPEVAARWPSSVLANVRALA